MKINNGRAVIALDPLAILSKRHGARDVSSVNVKPNLDFLMASETCKLMALAVLVAHSDPHDVRRSTGEARKILPYYQVSSSWMMG